MYGDYEYKFDEADERGSSSTLLTESGCAVVCEQNYEYPPSKSADHCCTLHDVARACQPSPIRFMTSHSDCTNKTLTKVKDADWSCDLAASNDTMATVVLEKTGHTGLGPDIAVFSAEEEQRVNMHIRTSDQYASSRSEVDETKSFTFHSMQCEEHHKVDWSELASARAALQSSRQSSDLSSRSDKGSQSWASDDEEPELRDLLINSSMETLASKASEDYEKRTQEDEVYDCNDQPEPGETQERNHLIVDENGTFEEVCLSSSTYFIACSGLDDAGGSCSYLQFSHHIIHSHLIIIAFYFSADRTEARSMISYI